MTLQEKIALSLQQLPAEAQQELLDFLEYLLLKRARAEMRSWGALSLAAAMRGMEAEDEEALYTLDDLKIVFS